MEKDEIDRYVKFGKAYFEDYLYTIDEHEWEISKPPKRSGKEQLEADTLYTELMENANFGTEWFLSRFFYRGRADELSAEYRKLCFKALEKTNHENCFNNAIDSGIFYEDNKKWEDVLKKPKNKKDEPNGRGKGIDYKKQFEELAQQKFEKDDKQYQYLPKFGKAFQECIKETREERKNPDFNINAKDLAMLFDALYWISKMKEKGWNSKSKFNPMPWVFGRIGDGPGGIQKVCRGLKEIHQVGPKLAALLIRDATRILIDAEKLEDKTTRDIETKLFEKNPNENGLVECLFPVDTWVEKLVNEKPGKPVEKSEVAKTALNQYRQVRMSSGKKPNLKEVLELASGIWSYGFNNIEVLRMRKNTVKALYSECIGLDIGIQNKN